MNTIDERLEEIKKELARQDAAFAAAAKQLEGLDNVQVHIPPEMLQEIEDACTVRTTSTTPPVFFGLRG